MTDREQVEATWKEYCDASKPTGVVHGTDVEEFDVDEMDRAAWELHQLNLTLLRERDAAEALAYERAAEIAEREMKKNAAETYSGGTVTVHRYGQSAAKCYAAGAILEGIRALAASPNALAEHDAKVRKPLEDEIERLRAALTPFAFMGEETDTVQDAWEIRYRDRFCDWIDFGEIEAARAALTQEGK